MKRPARKATGGGRPATGQVRVIGGRWRGSRLPVADIAGLRPTPDRVRETLFNWLVPALPGARVLDLFAGSGALGLEALSRGAESAVLVERDPALASALRQVTGRLQGAEAAQVVQADALAWMSAQPRGAFDIAFVDPPFAAGLWDDVLGALVPLMAADAWLHIEAPPEQPVALPPGWVLHREGRTREVRHALYRRSGAAPADTLAHDPAGPDSRPIDAPDQ